MSIDYDVFTTRNLGFATGEEQALLRAGGVFVLGVGGMGGACIQALVRAGLGHIAIADIDRFETSNLDRQVFAFTETLGQEKAQAVAAGALRINPGLDIEVFGAE
jgi:tRNA A37 threonylcarbamoyladenosine dehydratase